MKQLARLSALSYKTREDGLTVIEDFSFDTPKTKNMLELLKNFDLMGKNTLVVLNEVNENLLLSARNLKHVKIMRAADLNTYEIMKANRMLVTESSLKEIEKAYQN